MDAVKVESFQNLQQVVTARSHAWIADETHSGCSGLDWSILPQRGTVAQVLSTRWT